MDFVEDRIAYQPWRRRASRSPWRRHAAWIRRHQWPARVVIVLGEITAAYLCLIGGMVVGLVLRFAVT